MGIIGKIFGFDNSSASASTVTASCDPAPAKGGNWFNGIGKTAGTEPKSRTVYSKIGTPRRLEAADLLASGGEGVIYAMPGTDKILIKLYKNNILGDPRKNASNRERLDDMLRAKLDGHSCLAWPRAAVFNERREVIGFAMNRCSGTSFMTLGGGAAAVRRAFPNWDRSHLARTALDFVQKVAFLAARGVIINDFNPANFLVNEKCEVSFIDCDSFQIPRHGGGAHVTRTFFSSYVAPELLRTPSLLTRPRNIHHVEFGAAMIVFHLLMCGLHPYSYYDPSRQSACGTPDENLRKGRCPLGTGSDCRLPQGNWYNLWSWLTGTLKGCFIRTFRDGHADPARRVPLDELAAELRKLIEEMNRPAWKDVSGDAPKRRLLNPTMAKSHDYHRQPGAGGNSAQPYFIPGRSGGWIPRGTKL